jgi:hypothetical protein
VVITSLPTLQVASAGHHRHEEPTRGTTMSSTEPTSGTDREPGWVEIRVKGHLEARWSAWLDRLTLTRQDDGSTLIGGSVVDQSGLFGILHKLRDVALPPVSVMYIAGTSTL